MGQEGARLSSKGHQAEWPLNTKRREDEEKHGQLSHPYQRRAKVRADATRIALADGGDGIDDANFEEKTANATVLKLFELKRWVENVI